MELHGLLKSVWDLNPTHAWPWWSCSPQRTQNSWREEDKEQGCELRARTWLRVRRRGQLEIGGMSLVMGLEAGVCWH